MEAHNRGFDKSVEEQVRQPLELPEMPFADLL
jgi:hypothetical protein